jgi:signal transduction histidine kinase
MADPSIESRKSALRREAVWASILFALMFLAVTALGAVLIIKNLGEKETLKMLRGYSNELAELLAKVPMTETFKGYKQQTIVTRRLDQFFAEKKVFDSIELYDENGKLVRRDDRLRGGELLSGDLGILNLAPGQQRVETKNRIPIEVPVPIEPGRVGKAVLNVSEDVLARQAQEFRSELITRLISIFAAILFMVGLAYVYVLRVLKLTRKIEEEAQSHMRLSYLGLLSSGLAHEIKNPINSIQMNLQLLEEESEAAAGQADLKGLIGPIRKEFKRLERIVNDFLAFARPIKPELAPVDVGLLLRDLASLVAEEARRLGISIEVDPGEVEPVESDEGLLRTALLNLVLNAIQAGEEGMRIRLGAERRGDLCHIDVEDDGAGIPEDQQASIFEIFFTTKEGGTGLGLPIARRLVEGLGGTLVLVPKEGRGALFRVSLPAMR